jgi:hypothetical protein
MRKIPSSVVVWQGRSSFDDRPITILAHGSGAVYFAKLVR